MEKTLTSTPRDILISDKPIDGLSLILEWDNPIPRTAIFEQFYCLQVNADKFNWSTEFINSCSGQDPVDVLLDYIIDDGKQRWRNYSNFTGAAFRFRHPIDSLRSIVNAVEMYDKSKLYWYHV